MINSASFSLSSNQNSTTTRFVFDVPVLDRVDHRIAHGDTCPMYRVFVGPPCIASVVTQHLNEIQHIEITKTLKTDRLTNGKHAGDWATLTRALSRTQLTITAKIQ
jgi:hypothetical protein